jgi:hypothetical protein
MKIHKSLASLFSTICVVSANASPSHQAEPTTYDNIGAGQISGQTFIADEGLLNGVSWYIGDPTRPNLASVNGLSGAASLVLYDASNLTSLIELSRQSIVGAGDSVLGLTRFDFAVPVSTQVGTTYYISIEAADGFGIGLRSLTQSTYADGSQAVLTQFGLALDASGRDTSFEIQSSPVPEPATIGLMLAGIGLIAYKRTLQRRQNEA